MPPLSASRGTSSSSSPSPCAPEGTRRPLGSTWPTAACASSASTSRSSAGQAHAQPRRPPAAPWLPPFLPPPPPPPPASLRLPPSPFASLLLPPSPSLSLPLPPCLPLSALVCVCACGLGRLALARSLARSALVSLCVCGLGWGADMILSRGAHIQGTHNRAHARTARARALSLSHTCVRTHTPLCEAGVRVALSVAEEIRGGGGCVGHQGRKWQDCAQAPFPSCLTSVRGTSALINKPRS